MVEGRGKTLCVRLSSFRLQNQEFIYINLSLSMLALVLIPPLLFALTGIIDTYFVHILGEKQQRGILKNSIATLMIIG